jgi:hypothetical protein
VGKTSFDAVTTVFGIATDYVKDLGTNNKNNSQSSASNSSNLGSISQYNIRNNSTAPSSNTNRAYTALSPLPQQTLQANNKVSDKKITNSSNNK